MHRRLSRDVPRTRVAILSALACLLGLSMDSRADESELRFDYQVIPQCETSYAPIQEYRLLGDHVFGPVRKIQIPTFEIAVAEASVKDFSRFVADSGYVTDGEQNDGKCWGVVQLDEKISRRDGKFHWKNPGFSQLDDEPAVCVSHADATAYCEWLTRITGRVIRLPTSVEWRQAYTYRALDGNSFDFPIASDPGEYVNVLDVTYSLKDKRFRKAKFDDHFAFTAGVNAKPPGVSGLRFLHGNISEMCNCDASCLPKIHRELMVIMGESWQEELNPKVATDELFAMKRMPGSASVGFRVVREAKVDGK